MRGTSTILWWTLAAMACSGSDAVDDDKPSDDNGNGDDGNDETADTSVEGPEYWEPVAVGFEYDGTVLSDGSTGSFLYDDLDAGQTYERFPVMFLPFASQAFFEDQSLSDEAREAQTCVAF